jgi:hypothetical protein
MYACSMVKRRHDEDVVKIVNSAPSLDRLLVVKVISLLGSTSRQLLAPGCKGRVALEDLGLIRLTKLPQEGWRGADCFPELGLKMREVAKRPSLQLGRNLLRHMRDPPLLNPRLTA